MNPKEYHVAAVSWLNIGLRLKKARLALLGSLLISPLTTNERILDTLIFHIHVIFKGVLHLLPKISCFVLYLKIINNFLKNKVCIL